MKLKTIDQNGVKDFYEIEDWQQCELLIDLIELIGSNNVSSLEKLSKKKRRGTAADLGEHMQKSRDRALHYS